MKILNYKLLTKVNFFSKKQILIFIFSFLILTKFSIDPDLGWHLAMGKQFHQSGQIILGDQFSWTMPNYQWAHSYFAYQILTAFLFENFGHILTAFIFGIIGSLAILVVCKKLDFIKFLLVGFSALLVSPVIGIRPHTISFLFFGVLLVLLEKRFFEKWFQPIFFFLLFAIWANFHRGFLVGLVSLAFVLGVDYFWQRSKNKKPPVLVRMASVLAAILGTVATPFGLKAWQTGIIFDLSSRSNLLTIAEWLSIFFFFPMNVIFALTGLIYLYILIKKIKIVEPAWFLLGAFLFIFSFVATTFVFFWVAIFIFIVTRNLDFKLKFDTHFARLLMPILVTSVLGFGVWNFWQDFKQSLSLRNRLIVDGYPVAALEFLQGQNLNEGLFNKYEWGGYINWQAPQIKVFIDGRMASWRNSGGSQILDDYSKIAEGNCQVAGQYAIKIVLMPADSNNICFANWPKIFEDSQAKLLVEPI